MYQYNISFHDTMHTTKPTGTEIGNISNHLAETQMNYKELAHARWQHIKADWNWTHHLPTVDMNWHRME